MFKDYNKYLSTSLKVYLFVLVIVFILKVVGLDYFGLDLNNPTLIKISNYLSSNRIGDVYYFITLYLQLYFYLCLVCKKRKLYIYALIGTIINYAFQLLVQPTLEGAEGIYFILCFLITIIMPIIINKKFQIKRQLLYIVLINIYQLICLGIRNIGINSNYDNFLIDSLLNIDQLLLLAITYNIYFMKGGTLWTDIQEVGSSLQKKNHFSNLLKKLQKKYSQFKKLNKQQKATIIIYSILSLIWNIFTFVVVLFIAKLNDTFVECIFIITSFWLSKRVFGKPFHLKSMIQCFILSNLTYYVLNRITTPLGISIVIPIMLGVGLSYITSKFVKKIYKPLYKGMPEELFENTITKVVDKGSTKYNICYDFFIKKENAVYLGRRYNYTEAGIRQITSRVNNDIKALNK